MIWGGADGLAIGRWTGDHIGGSHLTNDLVQVVHAYVHLSSSSITWYWSKDGDVLQLGR